MTDYATGYSVQTLNGTKENIYSYFSNYFIIQKPLLYINDLNFIS